MRKKESKAIDAYTKSIALTPGSMSVMPRLQLLKLYSRRRNTSEAIPHLRELRRLVPDSAYICNTLGDCCLRERLFVEAKIAYEQSIAIKCDDASTHLKLAECLIFLGHLEEAEALLAKAESMGAIEERLLATKARSYFARDQFEIALACAQRAVDFFPSDDSLRILLGTIYQELGRFSEAEVSYLSALELTPGCFEAAFNLSQLSVARKDIQSAITWAKRAASISPDRSEAKTLIRDLEDAKN
jgi:Flp pilus assembly protein TadD